MIFLLRKEENCNLENKYLNLLDLILKNAENANFKGFNKHDALLSPIIHFLMGWSKITRLIAIQIVMRFPFNIRRLCGVPKSRNAKGLGLFAQSYLNVYKVSGNEKYLKKAEDLLDVLIEAADRSYNGYSWGYQYPWQDVGFFAKAGLSNRVVTCWVGFSFAEAYQLTKENKYRKVVNRISAFLLNAPNRIVDNSEELCFSYVPDKKVDWAVMDVSALTAKMLLLADQCNSESDLKEDAARCMKYIINRQTSYGAWYYTDPPKDSHITHDNYHTGIILDCIYDYMKLSGNWCYEKEYKKGLDYYKKELFTDEGAPKWMNNKQYPYDIHGAAQGIISFSKAAEKYPEYIGSAEKVLIWTMENMFNKKNYNFYYQKGRFITKKFNLLRWCNGWMSYAISFYLLRRETC